MKVNPVDATVAVVAVLVIWWVVALSLGLSKPPQHTPEWITVEAVVFTLPEVRSLMKPGDIAVREAPYARILSIGKEPSDRFKGAFINQAKEPMWAYLHTYRLVLELDCKSDYFRLYGYKVQVGVWYEFSVERQYEIRFWIVRFL